VPVNRDESADFFHRVLEKESGKTVRDVLRNRYRFSRRLFRRLKESGRVTLNGRPVLLADRVEEGDLIGVKLPEERTDIPPQPVSFTVVHEDADLVVVDKPPGLVVHPTKDYREYTLANGLVHRWTERGETHAVHPVTRLDKDTSGLLVIAKHAYAHDFLAGQMSRRRYRRGYLAVVHGEVPEEEGVIDAPIARCPERPSRRCVMEGGARAITRFAVVERLPGATLLRLFLDTGRTHQIRVHLAHRGHPIIGDPMYAEGWDTRGIGRQALHSAFLQLIHPRDGRKRSWESPLPPDIRELIRRLKGGG
jgi:23S rRNA pseudouridine1911/1915/1917 synthase